MPADLRGLVRRIRGLVGADADQVLLDRFVAGRDEEAFAELVRRHGPMILGVCRRVVRDEHRAEDAFQAALLVFAQKAGAIRHGERLGGWLYGVAFRVAQNARKQAARAQRDKELAPMNALDSAMPCEWKDVQAVLDEEIHRLPDKYRAPFVLCHLEGKTNDEAAALLGCPKGTVLSRLSRARERLQFRLTRRGVALSAGALAQLIDAESLRAAIPPLLFDTSVRTSLLVAAGRSLELAGVSAPVACLTQGAMRDMIWSKSHYFLVGALSLVLLGGMGWALAQLNKPEINNPVGAADKVEEEKLHPADKPKKIKTPLSVVKAALAPDGKHVLVVGRYELACVRLADDRVMWTWDSKIPKPEDNGWNGRGLWDVLCSTDGKTVVAVEHAHEEGRQYKKMHVICAAKGTLGRSIETLKGSVFAQSLSPDGTLLATAGFLPNLRIVVYDTITGKVAREIAPDQDQIVAMTFSPDSKRLATGGTIAAGVALQQTICVFDVANGKALQNFKTDVGLSGQLKFSPDGRTVAQIASASGKSGHHLSAFDLKTEKLVIGPVSNQGQVWFSQDGRTLVAADHAGVFTFLDASNGMELSQVVLDPGEKWTQPVWADCQNGTLMAFHKGQLYALDARYHVKKAPPVKPVDDADMERLWKDLSNKERQDHMQTVDTLTRVPKQTVPFFAKRLPAKLQRGDAKELTELIARLNGDDFNARTEAEKELTRLGELAIDPLQEWLDKGKWTIEQRRRVEKILDRWEKGKAEQAEWIRASWCIKILERIDTKESRELLDQLAKGSKHACGNDAGLALERMKKTD